MARWVLPWAGAQVNQVFGQLEGYPRGVTGPGGHPGTDYPAPYGTVIEAVSDGIVTVAGQSWDGGFGYNPVSIFHPADNVTTTYGHAEEHDCNVGDKVVAGQRIALVGSEGQSTGPHLHLEIRNGNVQYGTWYTNFDADAWLRQHGAYSPTGNITDGDDLVAMLPTVDTSQSLNLQNPTIRTLQGLLEARGGLINVRNGDHKALVLNVKTFQKNAGLPVDGVVGPTTWTALLKPLKVGKATL